MKKIKDIIKQHYFLNWLLFIALRYKYEVWKKECEVRREIDLFDYKKLATDLPIGLSHPIIDNNLYGLHEVLCNYGNLKTVRHKVFFEHGMIFGSLVQPHAITSFANEILTFSVYREDYIKKHGKKVIKIGPYIHYAEPLIDDLKNEELKKQLGKVLLVFPSHSIKSLKKEFDFKAFLTRIHECRKGFDNVLVCLYWKDVQLGHGKVYEDAGFRVVTAGHFYDKYFLSRLKTIIELSDMTMSNDIGTHLGYCVYLKKPHYIFGQDVKLEVLNEEKMKAEISQRSEEDWKAYYDVKHAFIDAFSTFECSLNEKQNAIVAELWGVDEILNRKQINEVLS